MYSIIKGAVFIVTLSIQTSWKSPHWSVQGPAPQWQVEEVRCDPKREPGPRVRWMSAGSPESSPFTRLLCQWLQPDHLSGWLCLPGKPAASRHWILCECTLIVRVLHVHVHVHPWMCPEWAVVPIIHVYCTCMYLFNLCIIITRMFCEHQTYANRKNLNWYTRSLPERNLVSSRIFCWFFFFFSPPAKCSTVEPP